MAELPSSEDKVSILRFYAQQFPLLRTFIETGTADGSTTAALVGEFDRLYTIELDHNVYLHNLNKFATEPKVLSLYGDSTDVLPQLLFALAGQPAIFWLDAHYSGGARGKIDTPIEAELRAIFHYSGPKVILIDDARLFGTDPSYPAVEWVKSVAQRDGTWDFSLHNDIMRITPGAMYST